MDARSGAEASEADTEALCKGYHFLVIVEIAIIQALGRVSASEVEAEVFSVFHLVFLLSLQGLNRVVGEVFGLPRGSGQFLPQSLGNTGFSVFLLPLLHDGLGLFLGHLVNGTVQDALESVALPRPIKIVARGLGDVVVILVPNSAVVGESVASIARGATSLVVLTVKGESEILCHSFCCFVVV